MRGILSTALAGMMAAAPATAQTLATVGGVPITRAQLIAADPAAQHDAATRNKDLVALVNRQAVLNEAARSGLSRTPAFVAALQQAEDNLVIELMAQRFIAAHPPSAAKIAAAYARISQEPALEQYRFREIVVSTFAAAQAVLARLRGGQDFSSLAAETSQDPSAAMGGEMGWQPATQLPAPVLEVLKTLAPGQVAGPVAVPQGFAVLQLLGIRVAAKPTLQQLRAQIIATLQQQEWIDAVIGWRNAQGVELATPQAGGD